MKKGRAVLLITAATIFSAFAAVVFFAGIKLSSIAGVYDILPTWTSLNYGLDLTGGVMAVLHADEASGAASDEAIEKAIGIITNRIGSLGLKGATVQKQGAKQVRICIPQASDQQETLRIISRTANISFEDPNGEVILTGDDISNAEYQRVLDSNGMNNETVRIEFSEEGKTKFAEATTEFIDQAITIKLDGDIVSAPVVQSAITDGVASISNIGTAQEAILLARLIRSGALPIPFEIAQVESIAPTLGEAALRRSTAACAVGLIAVIAYLAYAYRLLGVGASLALAVYMALYLNALALLKATLTLPAIGGIILSLGITAYINSIAFEQVKDQIAIGKSIDNSLSAGYANAMPLLLDISAAMLIIACALFFIGTGAAKGFAEAFATGIAIGIACFMALSKLFSKAVFAISGNQAPSMVGLKETLPRL
ncbi:MAG: protein translocase subunit SecD [Eubacteriaceae bacterium]|nr:protein translocase subunit SecD [Eubacteriaceae bacterium]